MGDYMTTPTRTILSHRLSIKDDLSNLCLLSHQVFATLNTTLFHADEKDGDRWHQNKRCNEPEWRPRITVGINNSTTDNWPDPCAALGHDVQQTEEHVPPAARDQLRHECLAV